MGDRIDKASPAARDLLLGLMQKEQRVRLGTHWVGVSDSPMTGPASPPPAMGAAASGGPPSGPKQQKRPSTAHTGAAGSIQIRSHPFFGGLDWDVVLARGYPVPFVPKVEHQHDLQNFDFTFTSEEVTRRGATESTQGIDMTVDIHDDSQRRFDNFTYVDDRDDAVSYNEKNTPQVSGRSLGPAGECPASPSLLPHTVMLIGEADGGTALGTASAVKHGVVDGEKQNPRLSPARIRMRRPSLGDALDLPPLPPPALSGAAMAKPPASAGAAQGGNAASVFLSGGEKAAH
jgi:hypothetical protein